ncbi:MAG: hypothetical protein GY768_27010 [Planctomycetaceae bacterium]|nr:hypothetical protein [Planctomycetaceae bacterium]
MLKQSPIWIFLFLSLLGCSTDSPSNVHDHHVATTEAPPKKRAIPTGLGEKKTEPISATKALKTLGAEITVNEEGQVIVIGLGNGDANLKDADLVHLQDFVDLEVLALNGPEITDAGLSYLKDLKHLKHLELYTPQITDAGLQSLSQLKGLNSLFLDGSKITDTGLAQLKGMTKLETLSIVDTSVTRAGVADLQQTLENCHIVD